MSREDNIRKAHANKLKNRGFALCEHVGNTERGYEQRMHPDGEPMMQVIKLQRRGKNWELPIAYKEMGWKIKEEKKTSTRRKSASADK